MPAMAAAKHPLSFGMIPMALGKHHVYLLPARARCA
jgi:hypothetical protein